MTDEERRIISDYVARISGAVPPPQAASGGPWGGSSVPATQARPPLPPVDPEADAFIAQMFQQYPEARYRLTQTAFVQEAALVEAQNRIRQLEWERDNARAQAQQAQAAPRQGGGFLGGIFGGGGGQQARPQPQQPMSPPPQPQYPPGYNPQALAPQRGGMGFLGTALAGAAGVAGGLVLGNALMGAFGGHGAAAAAGTGHGQDATAAAAGGAGASPWTDPAATAASQGWDSGGGAKDGFGGEDKFAAQPSPDQDATPTSWDGGGSGGGYQDNSSYQDDGSSGGGGGDYDSGGGGSDC